MASNVLVWVERSGASFSAGSLGCLGERQRTRDRVGRTSSSRSWWAAAWGSHAAAGDSVRLAQGRVLAGRRRPLGAPGGLDRTDSTRSTAAVVEVGATSRAVSRASVLGAEIAGGLAARLGVGVTTDGTDVRAEGGEVVVVRPALDDSILVELRFPADRSARAAWHRSVPRRFLRRGHAERWPCHRRSALTRFRIQGARRSPTCPMSSRTPVASTSPKRTSSSARVADSVARSTSTSRIRSPKPSAARWPRRVRWSTPAGTTTPRRWGRPARP